MITDVHHVHLPVPGGRADAARTFYVDVLGLTQVDAPEAVAARGGVWLRQRDVELRLDVAEPFAPAAMACAALRVDDLEEVLARLAAAGAEARTDDASPHATGGTPPEHRRVHVDDPFGNRLELVEGSRAPGADVVDVFLAAGQALVDVLDQLRPSSWDEPSAVQDYTEGGLAAHSARAIETVERYLAGPAPPRHASVVDAAGYFADVLGDHDPHDSAFHVAVRERATTAAARGPAAVAADARDALERLRGQLPAIRGDRPLAVRDDIATTVDEYLRTRIVELVVHVDDLLAGAAGSAVAPPHLPDAAWQVAAEVLAGVAVRRVGGAATVRSLARAERHPAPVRAL